MVAGAQVQHGNISLNGLAPEPIPYPGRHPSPSSRRVLSPSHLQGSASGIR